MNPYISYERDRRKNKKKVVIGGVSLVVFLALAVMGLIALSEVLSIGSSSST